jgi:hypothetical protein
MPTLQRLLAGASQLIRNAVRVSIALAAESNAIASNARSARSQTQAERRGFQSQVISLANEAFESFLSGSDFQ